MLVKGTCLVIPPARKQQITEFSSFTAQQLKTNKPKTKQTNQKQKEKKKKGKETAGYSLGRHKNYSFLKFSSGNMHRHVAILTTTKLTTCPIQINQANTVKIKDCSESVCRNPAY